MPIDLPIDPSRLGTRVVSGARMVFYVNGNPVAFASGVSGSVEIRHDPVETIDNLEVTEHVPVALTASLRCEIFRTVSAGASTQDKPGSLVQQKLFPRFGQRGERILMGLPVTAFVQDRNTNKVIYVVRGVKSASHDFNIQARGLVMQNVSFVCTNILDEDEAAAVAGGLQL